MRSSHTGTLYGFRLLVALSILATAVSFTACSRGGGGHAVNYLNGVVEDPSGDPVPNAKVYLIPASAVDETKVKASEVLDGTFADFDEPLEDLVDAAAAGTYVTAKTGADGRWQMFLPLPLSGDYFLFVKPAASDTVHVPGGSLCRRSIAATSLARSFRKIVLSGSPPPSATYEGTSACLECHPGKTHQLQTAHHLGFSVPGGEGGLQDKSLFPDFDTGLAYFTPADAYDDAGVTKVYLEDFDSTRGFDKFKTFLNTTGGGTVYMIAYLWNDNATGEYKITMENQLNGSDPNSPWTRVVKLTYGGAVHKQRYLLEVGGRKGLYPFLQFQHDGDESYYDRTRKVFRDYHGDWYWDAGPDANYGTNDDLLQDPPASKVFNGNCMACHSTGWNTWLDSGTGEWLSDAVDQDSSVDPEQKDGAYDIDGDGVLDEINLGCEVCHGPGSVHNKTEDPADIYCPDFFSPNRAALVCGRCHGRVEGNGTVKNDQPLNLSDEMPPPGTRRDVYLTDYTIRPGPKTSSYWPDEIHAKSHHQQYSEMIRSRKHRNDRILVVCWDCHDPHGGTGFEHQLTDDPDDPNSNLCQTCHAKDVSAHMLKEAGSVMAGEMTSCAKCHMPKTAKTGAGRYGFLLDTPTGDPGTDPSIVYWVNDIHSHFFDVPDKFSKGVKGVTPGSAMPIPYTNSCGICHDPSMIQYW